MRKFYLLAMVIAGSVTLVAQDYAIGSTSFTFTDPSRPGRNITTQIYYPAITSGENVPAATGPKFPYVIMAHGYLMSYSAYANIWEVLVPQGYIVVLPTTASELFPDHEEFGKDIAYLSLRFPKLGKSPASVLYSRVKSKCAAMGHSMGGGAVFLATQSINKINTTITLAAAETSPSAVDACATNVIPSLLFAGGDDCVTPLAGNQQPMYDNIAASCKALILISGGSHCQFANYNFNCSLGELFCSAGISRAEQQETMNTFLIPWLDYYLKNQESALLLFDSLLVTTAGISYEQECALPLRTGNIPADLSDEISIFP
ncbi:MAG: alpha/beta hydrolase family protein, partial [Chitinophagales bacterium]